MKKGFTLIELLAVIVILAIISLIAVPIVLNIINDVKKSSQEESFKLYGKAIENGIANYLLKHPTVNPETLTMEDIKDYVKYSGEKIDCEVLQINEKGKIYLANCSINNTKVEYEYGELIKPIVNLTPGLTPVIYDGDNWKVVDKNDPNWYDYDEQKWANAVVLGDVTKQVGDTVAVDGTEAKLMLVWIPRYEYKIEGDFGKGGQSAELPGEIEVNFIGKNTTTSTEGYILHPAFTFGDQDVSGFWVGKFELSHITKSQGNQSIEEVGTDEILNCTDVNCSEAQYLRTLPNKASLRYNNVSNFWYGIKSIENTQSFGLSNIDIHMVKNSEWGAVAYLSQSKYGKYGNADYENKYKEVYQNKSDNYITGSSNGTPCQSDSRSEGQCSYNNMQDLGLDSNGYKMGQCGPGASTTGNIYGVYDMSGGAWEYVMGAYGDNQGIYSGNSASYNSGFNGRTGNDNGNVTNGVDLPNSKYYDVYKTNNAETACDNEKPCLGHALLEIKGNTSDRGWYGDYGAMANLRYPWFVRGGAFSGLYAGIFEYDYTNGDIQKHVSSRFVGFGK